MPTQPTSIGSSEEPSGAAPAPERWMRRCLALARRGAGRVSPNPLVGAVLVGPGGEVLGEGWHRHFGGRHAEREAIAEAQAQGYGDRLSEATLYVNLEPCSHHGKTPPCTDAILEHEIPRVVVGLVDPFPEVAGQGIERLRAAGVEVEVGILRAEAYRLNEAFLHHVHTGRPLVTLKVAQTLDGQVATATGDARWISSKAARTLGHRWRSETDAVLVGSGTARADDPRLTVRHVEGRQPLRIVLDRTGQLDPDLQLFSDAFVGRTVAVLGEERPAPSYAEALQQTGGRLLRIPERGGHLDLEALLQTLGDGGAAADDPLQSVLVEAGPGLATALFRQDLVDRFFCFVAPKLIGRGVPVLGELGIEKVAEAHTFAEHTWEQVGTDLLLRGYLRPVQG